MPMTEARARFRVGQAIHHKRFDYRGVMVDVDPVFCGTEEW
jgi:heat shock protein HspQ